MKRYWIGIPPWIILGAVAILGTIFIFWAMENINKQKKNMTFLLLEKGAALIRSFEAGARTGMMGMHRGSFRLQRLLMETSQQPDIDYLIVTDIKGTILAHNDPDKIGEVYESGMDLESISHSEKVEWRQVPNQNGADTFEVFRRFSPSQGRHMGRYGRMMSEMLGPGHGLQEATGSKTDKIIFVGLDMEPIEAALKEDARHTMVMASILLLIGFAGIVSLFLAQAYRSAKTSLTRIKAFSDNVVENMPIGLLAIDSEGRIASFNQTAESILQYSSDKAIGKRADEVLPHELEALTGELGTEKGIIEREIGCTLEGGKRLPLETSVSLLEGEQGDFWGYIILFRDLTEVQELKREVERSQRLASLGKLAAGVAHEIRNPLSSIKGFATYFRERYRDIPEDRKTAEIMVQEVDRLNRVIGQLLEFARPMIVQKRPTAIQTVVRHSLKMIEAQARTKNIQINKTLPPDIKEVSLEADRISQVLLNLYLNAIEAMEDGGTLSVDLSWDDTFKRIKISVSDTGIGINKEDLVHVFDPYFTTKQSGTGLGLAIVHNIIEAHKGEVRVESETGKGTVVTIFLPLQ